MGPVMDRLRSAVAWSGSDVTLSMFVISSHAAAPPVELQNRCIPDRLRTYELDDEADVLGGQHLHEYDFVWKDLPSGLDEIVTACLTSALRDDAVVAWFGFEGSFDFRFLLHPDIAGQIYAVAADETVKLAFGDEYRSSDEWRRLLAELRGLLVR